MTSSWPLPRVLLATVAPGDRLWFWLTSRGPGGAPHLLLASREHDPDGVRFVADVKARGAQLGLIRDDYRGTVTVTPSGALRFAGEEPEDRFLDHLERLVERRAATCPPLLRLLGARYAQHLPSADPGDRVELVDDERWSPLVPGGRSVATWTQLLATAAVLRRLGPGDELAFWYSEEVAEPLWVIRPTPPERRADFLVEIERVRREHAEPTGLIGAGRVEEDGQLVFTVPDPTAPLLPKLSEYVRAHLEGVPELERLVGARVEHTGPTGERVVETGDEAWRSPRPFAMPADPAVLQRLRRALASPDEEGRWFAWFTLRSFNGAPCLVLTPVSAGVDAHRSDIRALSRGRRPLSRPTSGVATTSAEGTFRFQSRTPSPTFLADLEAFVRAHEQDVEALRRLEQAAFRVLEEDTASTSP